MTQGGVVGSAKRIRAVTLGANSSTVRASEVTDGARGREAGVDVGVRSDESESDVDMKRPGFCGGFNL